MRGCAAENVLYAVDIEAAGSESGRGPGGGHDGVTPHENVDAIKDTGLEHLCLGIGRHHLLAGTAEDRDTSGELLRRQVLRDGDGRGYADGPLGVMLIAVEGALGAAKRVVLDDDAQTRRGSGRVRSRHEGGREPGHSHFDFEVVLLEVGGELLDRA